MSKILHYSVNDREVQHIKEKDSNLARVIQKLGFCEITLSDNCFVSLLNSIIGQQLSNNVADILSDRFFNLFNTLPTPDDILNTSDIEIRKCGIADFKINYMRNLANAIKSGSVVFDQFESMSDSEIISTLTTIKGIGAWTAEMFLMFNLGRKNVFSVSDAGLRRAICQLYKIDKKQYNTDVLRYSRKWEPYKTIACYFLWAGLDRALL